MGMKFGRNNFQVICKYASIDEVGFSIWRHTKLATLTNRAPVESQTIDVSLLFCWRDQSDRICESAETTKSHFAGTRQTDRDKTDNDIRSINRRPCREHRWPGFIGPAFRFDFAIIDYRFPSAVVMTFKSVSESWFIATGLKVVCRKFVFL